MAFKPTQLVLLLMLALLGTACDPGCQTCSGSVCSACTNTSYYLQLSNSTCVVCSTNLAGCQTCSNSTFCLTVVDIKHFIASNGTSYGCDDLMFNCDSCTVYDQATSNYTCLWCKNGAGKNRSDIVCGSCGGMMDGCYTCSNESYCHSCQDEYYLANSTTCILCSSVIPFCYNCSGPTNCYSCIHTGYYFGTDNQCHPCSTQLSNCVNCTANASISVYTCTFCLDICYLSSNGTCEFCNTTLIYCVTCSSSSFCTSCDLTTGICHDSLVGVCANCQDYISHCVDCSSCFSCTVCENISYFVAAGGVACLECAIAIPGCETCSNSSVCISCFNNSYFLDADNICYLCSEEDKYCLLCQKDLNSTVFTCFLCSNASYFLNSSARCQSCSSQIPFCQNCDNDTYCTQCINNSYGFYQLNITCQPCYILFSGCELCTSTHCTQCLPDFVIVNGEANCSCIVGWEVNGICTSIFGCIKPVNYPSGLKGCMKCESSQFFVIPVDSACQCLVGVLAGRVCINTMGCMTALTDIFGNPTCYWCNIGSGFQGTPDSNGDCICESYLALNGYECKPVCGDGFLVTPEDCDDGNLISGDGCSPSCIIETGYKCANGSLTTPSICMYIGIPLKASLESIQRPGIPHQGAFTFSVFPPLVSIGKLNLLQLILLNCNSDIRLAEAKYQAGTLTILVDYFEDLEGKACTIEMDFNSTSFIASQKITMSFEAVSRTIPLRITKNPSLVSTISFIFQILSLCALALFVVSLLHKMIGAETLTVFQLVYISNCVYKRSNFFYLATRDAGWVTGGWQYYQPDYDYTSILTAKLQISKYFIENSLILQGIYLTATFIWIIIFLIYSCQNTCQQEEDSRPPSNRIFYNIIVALYQYLIFPLTAAFLLVITITIYVNNRSLESAQPHLGSLQASSLCQIIVMILFSSVLAPESIGLGSKNPFLKAVIGVDKAKSWYPRIFLLRSIIIGFLIQVGQAIGSFNLIAYALVALMLAYSLALVFYRPYKQCFSNIGVFICNLTSLFTLALPIIFSLISFSQPYELLLLMVLEGFLSLCLLMGTIRVFLQYWTRYKRWRQKSGITKADQNKQNVSYNQENKQDNELLSKLSLKRINPYSVILSTSKQMRRQPDNQQEQGEVEKLKSKLREDLLIKRQLSSLKDKQNNKSLSYIV